MMNGIDLPVVVMPVSELAWFLDYPVWSEDRQETAVTPLQRARDRLRHEEQSSRTMRRSLLINDHWLIMDGVHWLLKVSILGNKTRFAKLALEEHGPSIGRM